METELMMIVGGWIVIKIIEWAANNRKSVLTTDELYILKQLESQQKEDRQDLRDLTHALNEVAKTQLQVLATLQNLINR